MEEGSTLKLLRLNHLLHSMNFQTFALMKQPLTAELKRKLNLQKMKPRLYRIWTLNLRVGNRFQRHRVFKFLSNKWKSYKTSTSTLRPKTPKTVQVSKPVDWLQWNEDPTKDFIPFLHNIHYSFYFYFCKINKILPKWTLTSVSGGEEQLQRLRRVSHFFGKIQ